MTQRRKQIHGQTRRHAYRHTQPHARTHMHARRDERTHARTHARTHTERKRGTDLFIAHINKTFFCIQFKPQAPPYEARINGNISAFLFFIFFMPVLCLGSPLRNKAIEIATVPYLKTTLTALGAYKAIQNNNNNMADRTMLQHGWRRGGIPHVVE